jgi:fructose-bisphosphate aldolase class I
VQIRYPSLSFDNRSFLRSKKRLQKTISVLTLKFPQITIFLCYNEIMSNQLHHIAQTLLARPKGLLAADESLASIPKRFDPYKLANTPENRRQFRLLYLTAPDIEPYLSGVILHEETVFQTTDDGETIVELLTHRGIVPGVKVDLGVTSLPNFPNETVTLGLDTLDQRLQQYATLGLKFTKWRAAIPINESQNLPTDPALLANVHALTRYALSCQAAGIVPIVEPEVLLDGPHSLDHSAWVLSRVLHLLFEHLHYYQVDLSGLILKTSMAISGSEHQPPASTADVARTTVAVLNEQVPSSVAGIVFLSGGQTPDQATANLAAITALGSQPWPLTFSFARALQAPALAEWQGKTKNFAAAQKVFLSTLQANSAAVQT